MKNFTVLICLLWTSGLFGQNTINTNNTLRGEIVFMNSGKQPATGVEVAGTAEAGETANIVYTNAQGAYELKFPVSRVGFPVDLKIGSTDGKGKAIEVVNEKEVELCKIPAKVTDVFKVIVCPKGYRDLAAQKYYNIIKTSSDIALANKEKVLNNLLNDRKKDYQKITELTAELDRLQQQTDSVKIYQEAFQIASINKDDASKRVLRYIELLEEGKSIQEAREALSIKEASKELDASISQFKAAIEELERRAGASVSIFDYKDAIACYDTMIVKSEFMGVNPLLIASYYAETGSILTDDGNFKTALSYYQESMAIREKILASNHIDLAKSYNSIARAYHYLGQYEKAMEYNLKAIAIKEDVLASNHLSLATSYGNIAVVYLSLGQYEKALEYNLKAISIREKALASNHPDLALSYNNVAKLYYSMGQYEKALEYYQKAIAIFEKVLDPNHPDLASTYSNVALVYSDTGQYEKAIEYNQKSIDIREKMLDPNHPDLATSYGNAASIYNDMDKHEKALEYNQKAITIFEKVLDPNHPDLATTYNNFAVLYHAIDKYDKALEYQQKALAINEKVLDSNNPDLAILYSNLGALYRKINDYDKAITYTKKCNTIFNIALPADHPNKQIVVGNLIDIYKSAAIHYMQQSEKNTALNHLQSAIVSGFNDLDWLTTTVELKSLQEDPAFKEIIKNLKIKIKENAKLNSEQKDKEDLNHKRKNQ